MPVACWLHPTVPNSQTGCASIASPVASHTAEYMVPAMTPSFSQPKAQASSGTTGETIAEAVGKAARRLHFLTFLRLFRLLAVPVCQFRLQQQSIRKHRGDSPTGCAVLEFPFLVSPAGGACFSVGSIPPQPNSQTGCATIASPIVPHMADAPAHATSD